MRRSIQFVLLLLLSATVYGQAPPTCLPAIPDPIPRDSVRWTWTAPTKNTDGSNVKLPLTFTIYEGAMKVCQIVTTTAASWSGLSVGTHSWHITSMNSDGESAPSNTASKTIPPPPPPPPNPPTNLQSN